MLLMGAACELTAQFGVSHKMLCAVLLEPVTGIATMVEIGSIEIEPDDCEVAVRLSMIRPIP